MAHGIQRAISARVVILAVLLLACGVVLLFVAKPFLPSLVWALTLAVMLGPMQRKLLTATGSRALSLGITLIAAGCLVIIPVVLVTGILLNELAYDMATYQDLITASGFAELKQNYPGLAVILDRIDQWIDFPQFLQILTAQAKEWGGALVEGSASSFIVLLLTYYFLFYFLRDADALLAGLRKLVPLPEAEFTEITMRTVQTVFASVYATVAVAAIQGLLGGLMFWVLDLPSPALWGVVMGLLAIIPFLGAFVIWGPAAVGLALNGDWGSAIVLSAWGMIVVGLIDNVLYPIIVGRRLSLHPMVSFIAIVGGVLLFGAHGIVLGPLAMAAGLVVLQLLQTPSLSAKTEGDDG
jgi:predicted PurR-regulated permease PerM